MGRPKVIEFTGLEDLESQDSRPAKKKKERQDAPIVAEAKANEPLAESTESLVEDLKGDAVQELSGDNTEANLENSDNKENEIPASESKDKEAEPVKVQPKVGKAKIRSKRYQAIHALVEKGKAYPAEEALKTLKATAKTKFDPTLELHINIGADITKTDQQVRVTTTLPHSSGKTPNLLVFGNFKAEEGVTIGDEKTIDTIEKTGRVSAEKIIATPEWMPKLTKVAKILGPKGIMPNPKTGTVTTDVAKTVADFKGGLLEICTEAGGPIIHTKVGKLSLDEEKLIENLKALIDVVNKAKPAGIKRNYLKSAYLHVTMGPSIKLDISSLN